MSKPSHPEIYDTIGVGYRRQRLPDARISEAIRSALGDSRTVCNIGAGTGSYEPLDLDVTAVEPSRRMIEQRTNSFPVIQASAESLPFADDSFDASMAVLTIHHWLDPIRGLREMQRVSQRQVVFAFDPQMIDSLWLVRDYFPEIIEFEQKRALPFSVITETLGAQSVEIVPIPWDCTDGFQAAYWRRPEFYLRQEIRDAISTFAQLPESVVARGVEKLAEDIRSGAWHQQYANLLELDEMDFGYRLVTACKNAGSQSGT